MREIERFPGQNKESSTGQRFLHFKGKFRLEVWRGTGNNDVESRGPVANSVWLVSGRRGRTLTPLFSSDIVLLKRHLTYHNECTSKNHKKKYTLVKDVKRSWERKDLKILQFDVYFRLSISVVLSSTWQPEIKEGGELLEWGREVRRRF